MGIKVELVDSMGSDLNVVNAARTKTHERILEAVERGYTVNEQGEFFGPKGKLTIKKSGKQRYPTFSTNWGGFVFGIPAHIFAAYVFYGDDAFQEGIVVRHLNADTEDLSKNNIVLGTHSENNLDKPSEARSRAAKKARAAQGKTPTNAKLTQDQVQEVIDFYEGLEGKKAGNGLVAALANKLGVSRTVLQNIKNGESYVTN